MIVARDFVVALVGLRPPDATTKSQSPAVQCNPAGIHLISAGRCPNNRSQLSPSGISRFTTMRISITAASS